MLQHQRDEWYLKLAEQEVKPNSNKKGYNLFESDSESDGVVDDIKNGFTVD